MATTELKVIKSVCEQKDIHVLMGEDNELFGPYGDIVTFMRDHYATYKGVPEYKLLLDKFPDLEDVEVAGSSQYLVDQLKKEHIKSRMQRFMLSAAEGLEKKDPAEILERFQTELAKLGKYTMVGKDVNLTDIDDAIEYVEKVKQLSAENGGTPGIPTGIPSIDLAYPTGMAAGHLIVAFGYAQPYSEPVLTPSGWAKMGELAVGDFVVGSDGCENRVEEIFEQGAREVFKVNFSDGTFVLCDKNHLWTVQTRKSRQIGGHQITLSTEQIAERVRYEGYRETCYKYFLPLPAPIVGVHLDSIIGPYLYGQLLGDGCLCVSSIRLTTNDAEAIDRCRLENPDIVIDEVTLSKSTARQWIVRGGHIKLGLVNERGLKSSTKFIPSHWMNASIDQRYELLRGLMDADGHSPVGNTRSSFTTTSSQLASDVASLARSLGGVAKVYRTTRIYSTGEQGFAVSIWTPLNPFGINRKAKNYNPTRSAFKAISSIEKTSEIENMRCIRVSAPDNLYITRDYALTHNTGKAKSFFTLLLACRAWAAGYSPMIISLEMSPEEVRERAYAIMSSGLFPITDMSRGEVSIDDLKEWGNKALKDKPGFYVPSNQGISDMTPNVIQARIDKYQPQLVIYDYMQLGSDNAKTREMTPKMMNQSRELKLLAVRNEIPIIAISAVTDDEHDKRDSPPRLGQMAWSKAIEYDANLAMAVHRHDDSGLVEIDGVKVRNGVLFNTMFEVDINRGIWKEHL